MSEFQPPIDPVIVESPVIPELPPEGFIPQGSDEFTIMQPSRASEEYVENKEILSNPDLSLLSERMAQLQVDGAGSLTVYDGGGKDMPEWWYSSGSTESKRAIEAASKRGELTPGEVQAYFDIYSKEQEFRKSNGLSHFQDGVLGQFVYSMGEKPAGEALSMEDEGGPLKEAMLGELKKYNESKSGVPGSLLSVLKSVYGVEDATGLLGIRDREDDFSRSVYEELLKPSMIGRMLYEDARYDSDLDFSEYKKVFKEWMNRAISEASGVSVDEVGKYTFTATSRLESDNVISIVEVFNYFGEERIRKIAKETGIHGLECYSIAQLEMMERFATDPEALAEYLEDKDVNVVMVNRVGDHNGVMTDTAQKFDDEAARTLFFEINTMDDIYRTMAKLNRTGIKPSTMVLAAHSAPGQFMVTDDRDPDAKRRDVAAVAARRFVEQANTAENVEPGLRGYSMHGMKGMARLVEDYMRPSRAVNDNSADKGRKKIIFNACNAGKKVGIADLDSSGSTIEAGSDSVISRIGSDLRDSGISSKVDLYGADEGIQMHRTDAGTRYSGPPVDFDSGRKPIKAIRIRLEGKKITRGRVAEIKLRK